jgi:dihydrofolate reductase
MSLDGFITGPNDDVARPLGEGGERLHQWVYELASWRERHGLAGGKTNRDAEVLDEAFRNVGAFVMGRRMFNHGEKPWGDDPPFHMPVFVVTHDHRDTLVKEGGTTFTFVTDGIESALEQAKAAAGSKDVSVAGGANIVQQLLKAGLLDEIQIHLVPVTLGGGRRLFEKLGKMELEPARVIESPGVTHLRYHMRRT